LLGIPDNEVIICGMALGYADPGAVINRLQTERVAPTQFARFEGFEE
jgi:hypothetical protein